MSIRIVTILLLILTFTAEGTIWAEPNSYNKSKANIGIYNTNKIRLDIITDFRRGVTAYQDEQFPDAIKILTGNFFNKADFKVATLLIREGKFYHKPSNKKNRPVIAQEKSVLGDKIVITTNTKAWENRQRYRVAIEAGPFLIVEGKDWYHFNFRDPSFYRYTRRVGVGLTYDDQFFFAEGSGTLDQFRNLIKDRVPKIKYLMNLDGGSSAFAYRRLPTRLVINLKK